MSLKDMVTGIRRHFLLLLAGAVLGTLAGMGVTWQTAPVYTTSATVFTTVPASGEGTDQAYQGSLFAQQRVRSYAALVTTPTVTGPVVRELGLDLHPDALAGRLQVDVPVDTTLLNITINDGDGPGAARAVNAVADELIEQITRLETPAAGRPPNVRAEVVRPAPVPTEPVSPEPTLNLVAGLVVGALAGVGVGALRAGLDTRIRDAESVKDVPVLTEVPATRNADALAIGGEGLEPGGGRRSAPGGGRRSAPGGGRRSAGRGFVPYREAFGRLRTNLRFLSVDKPPRVIVVTSPLAGDGKSSTVLGLALALAKDGAGVAIVDADLRRPTLGARLGLVDEAGLSTVLSGQAELIDLIQSTELGAEMHVLTSGPIPPSPSEMLGSGRMRSLITELRKTFDYVLLDAPPLLPVTDAAVLSAGVADGTIIVARAKSTRRERLKETIEGLEGVGAAVLGVVLNRTAAPRAAGYGYSSRAQPETRKPRKAALR